MANNGLKTSVPESGRGEDLIKQLKFDIPFQGENEVLVLDNNWSIEPCDQDNRVLCCLDEHKKPVKRKIRAYLVNSLCILKAQSKGDLKFTCEKGTARSRAGGDRVVWQPKKVE